ncbi:MAG: hypothetical protein IJ127_26700 [Afipia sp.]|nr:hypothetical protein [Afipia sp.]
MPQIGRDQHRNVQLLRERNQHLAIECLDMGHQKMRWLQAKQKVLINSIDLYGEHQLLRRRPMLEDLLFSFDISEDISAIACELNLIRHAQTGAALLILEAKNVLRVEDFGNDVKMVGRRQQHRPLHVGRFSFCDFDHMPIRNCIRSIAVHGNQWCAVSHSSNSSARLWSRRLQHSKTGSQ